jgi:hypothetical protein
MGRLSDEPTSTQHERYETELKRIAKLFPEAEVIVHPMWLIEKDAGSRPPADVRL